MTRKEKLVLIGAGSLSFGLGTVGSLLACKAIEGATICLHDIFHFNQIGIDDNGKAYGNFEACGVRPRLLDRLKAEGVEIPHDLFRRRVLTKSNSEENKKLLRRDK